MSLNTLSLGLYNIHIMCVFGTHFYNLVAKATWQVKGHSDGAAVHCDRSRQEVDFNRNVRSRGAIMVANRNLRHKRQPFKL